jgi:hypothetical protein
VARLFVFYCVGAGRKGAFKKGFEDGVGTIGESFGEM